MCLGVRRVISKVGLWGLWLHEYLCSIRREWARGRGHCSGPAIIDLLKENHDIARPSECSREVGDLEFLCAIS